MYLFFNFSLQLGMVNFGGICKFSWQCTGTGIYGHGLCSCSSGCTQIGGKCYQGKIFQVYGNKYHS